MIEKEEKNVIHKWAIFKAFHPGPTPEHQSSQISQEYSYFPRPYFMCWTKELCPSLVRKETINVGNNCSLVVA